MNLELHYLPSMGLSAVPSLIGSSWQFLRKQPAMLPIAAWLIAIPYALFEAANNLLGPANNPAVLPAEETVMIVLFMAAMSVLFLWGHASTLTVGRRLLQTNAGRSRTSFRAVIKQSRGFIIPLLLTYILWTCMTFLWGILLIVPGIFFFVRTFLFPVAVVGEGINYRQALYRSRTLVKGRFGEFFLMLLALFILLFWFPWFVVTLLFIVLPVSPTTYAFYVVIDAIVSTIGLLLFNISLIQIYKTLLPGPVHN